MPDLILAIETSNPTAHPGAAGVALGRRTPSGLEILAEEPVSPQTRLDDDLMPAVDRVFGRVRAAPRDLAGVAVSVGPGGYTSVRIGVSAARVIARVTGSVVFAIPTAHVGAVGASRLVPGGTMLSVCLAWKHDEVWRHRFCAGDPPRSLDEGTLVPVTGIAASDMLVMDQEFIDRLASIGLGVDPARAIPMRLSGADVIRACAWIPSGSPESLMPIYPREPEAVTKWRLRAQAHRTQ